MNPSVTYCKTSLRIAELIRHYQHISMRCQTLMAECGPRLELLEQKQADLATVYWTHPLDLSKLDSLSKHLQSMGTSDRMLEDSLKLTQDMLSLTLTLAKLREESSPSYQTTLDFWKPTTK